MPGYNPFPGKAAGGKTQKKATAVSRARANSTAGKIATEVGKQLVYAPLYLVPGGSSIRGAAVLAKTVRATNAARLPGEAPITIGKLLATQTRNTARLANPKNIPLTKAATARNVAKNPAFAEATRKKVSAAVTRNVERRKYVERTGARTRYEPESYSQGLRMTYGELRAAGKAPKLQTSPTKGVATVGGMSTKRKIAGAAVATGAAAYGLSRIPTSSAAAPRQKYSGMKAGAEKVRTGPGGAYVGSGMGAKARPKTGGGAYVGSTVGGNTGSRKTPAAPSGPSGGGGGGRPRQAGASKKQVQARRAAITDLLKSAEEAAAAGNIQAAANFSAAALNRQRAGKGSAASMKRVTKVARAYSTAAGRKKIENQEAGRTRLGKPPSNRRYA